MPKVCQQRARASIPCPDRWANHHAPLPWFPHCACESSYIKDFLDLNEIEYQIANISEDIKLSKIAKNERGKIRLLECYAHNDQFKLID